VVVGIIALLLALLLPATARARRQARTAVCLTNLRQLQAGFQMYVNENKGRAFVGYGSKDNFWHVILKRYLRDGDGGVMYCPEALQRTGLESTRGWFVKLPTPDSSTTPLFGDCAADMVWPRDSDTPPDNLYTPVPTTGNWGPEVGHMRAFCMARHGRAINVVFLDGHAQTVPLPELWKLKWHRDFVPTDVTVPPG
jgi:prepilin-type processing-associated H-X9-DG protein